MTRSSARQARPRLAAPFLALLAVGCGIFGGGGPDLPEVARFSLEQLYYDDVGGVEDSVRRVIRDSTAYREAWEDATRHRTDPVPPARVDFERDMVLLVAGGQMRTGDEVRADSAYVQDEFATPEGRDERRVLIVTVRTIRGCGQFAGDAYPVQLVRIARFAGMVRFNNVNEQRSCPG